MRREQIVERCDLAPPRQPGGHLQPLGVLVEHRVDDVDEGFVAVEQAVSSGEQVTFQPALALMLAQHRVEYASGRGEELIARTRRGLPLARRYFEERAQSV